MRLDIFVEEQSAEAALRNLIHRILPETEIDVRFHPFRGKQDLLKKLPGQLKAYRHWIADNHYLIVLVDRDTEDCELLKGRLESYAIEAGLKTLSKTRERFQVINRIAIEELEAWFFGDVEALHAAYPRVPVSIGERAPFRDPDAISGGTSERLEKLLRDKGYQRGGLQKIRTAREISLHMDVNLNRSRSFQVFRDALRKIPQRVQDE
ncbi:MAG: DUF4276 family protein [Anaerolineaceae bacterium]|nr:DUF4276 family protein [Anaerolineaceae bacterium]